MIKCEFSQKSSIPLNLESATLVLNQELVNYYKQAADELQERLKLKELEIKNYAEMNEYYQSQILELADINSTLKRKVDELEHERDEDDKRHK